ncbi:dolichol-phosphate mannosyltransferase subunit 3 [Penicillium lagena]|uniref:dolichol-phosphate mannosyltransferase subunit 3 n=1 Tax=Penicillium lagena TaxID=94218 RepID=UPI0025424F8F|nr:dolichol-phosphate mannosyltransferase subunit 3 [Penicillium lagena]KAJ5605042.1 dolichol-phosphate mannosyltransferase subunit 3 [Penicillium lagena]
MTRAQQTLSVLLLVSSLTVPQLYLSLYLGLVPLNETLQNEVIPVLPFYALIVFGCYLLGRLGVAIFTFNDVPEAHAELQKEIEQAKIELRQGKVDVD